MSQRRRDGKAQDALPTGVGREAGRTTHIAVAKGELYEGTKSFLDGCVDDTEEIPFRRPLKNDGLPVPPSAQCKNVFMYAMPQFEVSKLIDAKCVHSVCEYILMLFCCKGEAGRRYITLAVNVSTFAGLFKPSLCHRQRKLSTFRTE